MAKKLTTFDKLRRSFENIGVTLGDLDDNGIVSFDYDHWSYLLGVVNEHEIFYLTEYIVGPDGNVPKHIFESALDVTKHFHKYIDGEWNDECAWISTPCYTLKGCRSLPKTVLRGLLKDFFEAHSFMECNVFMMMDKSIWRDMPTDNLNLEHP